MKRLNIALMTGGNSSEREVALNSASQIEKALNHEKYNVISIDVHARSWSHKDGTGRCFEVDKNDFSITIDSTKTLFEYALIMIHGTPGEDGKLQGYLDMMGVSYSACNVVSSVITFDKISCKRAVMGCGINLAREIFIRKTEKVNPKYIVDTLGLPVFVKPNASGSSFGVTKVKTIEELLPALEEAYKESDAALVEEFLDGREMGCGVLVTKDKEYVFPVTEIISKKEFFDYEAKYTDGFSDEITPADIDEKTRALLGEMALKAYCACGCRGIVRIDFIVRPDSTPYMIEINSIPGMSSGSIVPKQISQMGMTLGELYDIIIEDTLAKA